jgi:ABC-2 type transport system permease protein
MFRSIYTKTLRDYRVPILAWGIGLALVVYGTLAAYATQFTTPESQAGIVTLAETFRFIADPVEVTSPTGFVTWRSFGLLPVFLGIWAALAGARLTRGAEERGTLDTILALPITRTRYLLEGLAALATALALVGILIGLGVLGGAVAVGVTLSPGAAIMSGLNVGLGAFVGGTLALLIAQFAPRTGTASGLAVGLLLLAWLLDGVGRAIAGAEWLGRLSPYRLYSSNKPLIADYPVSIGGYLGLALLALLAAALSFPPFVRRDLGGVAWARHQTAQRTNAIGALAGAARVPWLREPGLLALRAALPGIAAWTVGLVALTLLVIGITPTTKDSVAATLQESPALVQIFSAAGLNTDAGFLSGLLFFFLPLMTTLYALVITGGWARDLDAGRHELALGTPLSRGRLYLANGGATLAALVLTLLALWLAALLGIRIWGLHVDGGHLLAAFTGLLPLELPFAALVYLGAGRLSAGTLSGIVGALIGIAFMLALLAPLLALPHWALNFSPFYQYGAPIVEGPRWGTWLLLTAIAALIAALGYIRFNRDDLQRGN